MAIGTTNPLKVQYDKTALAYEELVLSTTPYLWAKALNGLTEAQLAELEHRLTDIRDLEAEQLALLEELLPAYREELARLLAAGIQSDDSCGNEEDDWLDTKFKIMQAEGELHEMMEQIAILRRADLRARPKRACQ